MDKKKAIQFVQRILEGPGDHDSRDRGGETFWGVTHIAWKDYLGDHTAEWPPKDTSAEAMLPVYDFFWLRMELDDLPECLQLTVFAFGFVAGYGTAIKAVQHSLGLQADGHLGPMTRGGYSVLMSSDDIVLERERIAIYMVQHYFDCKDSDWSRKGWINRLVKTLVRS